MWNLRLLTAMIAITLGCGPSEPEADASLDVGSDASLDASSDASLADAGEDAGSDASDADGCLPGELPSITSLTLTPSNPSPGEEVTARVVTRCFTPPISRVEVFTRDPRVELAASADPSDDGELALTVVSAALDALDPGTYEVGVSVTSAAETLTQERLATLEVSP